MNAKVIHKSTKIRDFLIIQHDEHTDHRGGNFESYNKDVYDKFFGRNIDFKVDSYSRSVENVLRGLHGDFTNWKLIEVIDGSVFFVAIDLNPSSPTYGGREELVLSGLNHLQVFLPPGCVNGHCVLTEKAIFHYRLSHGFTEQSDQLSLKWNNPAFNIWWPTQHPILSKRDQ